MVCKGLPLSSHRTIVCNIMLKLFRINANHERDLRVSSALPATVVLVAASILMMSPAASYSSERAAAHTARSLNATTTAHLHLVKAEGSELFEEGAVSATLPGSMQAEL